MKARWVEKLSEPADAATKTVAVVHGYRVVELVHVLGGEAEWLAGCMQVRQAWRALSDCLGFSMNGNNHEAPPAEEAFDTWVPLASLFQRDGSPQRVGVSTVVSRERSSGGIAPSGARPWVHGRGRFDAVGLVVPVLGLRWRILITCVVFPARCLLAVGDGGQVAALPTWQALSSSS